MDFIILDTMAQNPPEFCKKKSLQKNFLVTVLTITQQIIRSNLAAYKKCLSAK